MSSGIRIGLVGIILGPDGDLSVASVGTQQVLRYDGRTGAFREVVVDAGEGGLAGPRMIAFKATLTLCHRPPGNPAKGKTRTLAYWSGVDHVGHGDALGRCD